MATVIGRAIGIDVGGTSVKAGLVDLTTGRLVGDRVRQRSPEPAAVGPIVEIAAGLVTRLEATHGPLARPPLPVGAGLSSDVLDGQHTSGVSLDPSWLGAPARELLEARLDRPVTILNDADAAALAEARYGAAGGDGLIVVLTFGTGIGSGILSDGRLVPNSGLGQLRVDDLPAELTLSAVNRERLGRDWASWAASTSGYLRELDELLRPRRFVIAGGIVHAWGEFGALLDVPLEVVPAALGNDAGIVGAAIAAAAEAEAGRTD